VVTEQATLLLLYPIVELGEVEVVEVVEAVEVVVVEEEQVVAVWQLAQPD
jgi:hypothetical protein